MKHKLLTLMALAFVALGINAQTWTEPEPPTAGSDPVSGHLYRIKNVEAGTFIGGGAVWFGWGTTACLIEQEEAITFTATEEFDEEGNSKGWTFKGYDGNWPNNYLFVSGNNGQGSFGTDPEEVGYAMHVDNPTDTHRYFELLKQDNGYYRVRVAAADDTYGQAAVEDWENKFWGWNSAEENYPHNLHASVRASETMKVDFEFCDYSVYQAKQQIYQLAMTIEEEGLEVEYDAYTAVYEGSDVDALNTLIDLLKRAITEARAEKIFAVGEDGINPPSTENPADVSAIIENPEFYDCTNGKFPGWTIYAPNGGNTWVNGSDFVEYWNASSAKGVFDYYQELAGLPAGLYSLTARMWNSTNGEGGATFKPTSGVYGTTSAGTTAALVDVDCDNGDLHEYTTVPFVLPAGSPLRIGVKNMETMAARWFGVDYIHLTYYGPVDDPDKAVLDVLISTCETNYEYMDEVYAEASVKEAYEAALAEAKNAVGDYAAQTELLQAAVDALKASIADYQRLKTLIDQWREKMAEMTDKWEGANDAIADRLDAIEEAYDNGTYTAEDIDEAEQFLSNTFADFIGRLVEKDDDLTFLLNNPDFVTDFSGWTVDEEGATPVHGGVGITIPGDHPRYEELLPYLDENNVLNNGNAEVYESTFDISQTIVNMPAGVFTFSCQAFQRDGDWAEFYAILPDGTEQTMKVKDLYSEVSPVQLYDGSYGGSNYKITDKTYNGGYVPDGQEGANVYFKLGYYKNFFDINMPERGNLTVGVRNTATNTRNWVLFDDFKIVYKGDGGSAYQETIERLRDEVEALQDKANDYSDTGAEEIFYLTKEADDTINDALDAADEALGNIDDLSKEDAQTVIAQLNQAKDVAEESATVAAKLHSEVQAIAENRMSEVTSSDKNLSTLVGEVADKLDTAQGFETVADMEQAIIDLHKAFTVYVMTDVAADAKEDNAVDVTAVIYNPDYQNYHLAVTADELTVPDLTGWTVKGGAGFYEVDDNGDEVGFAEFYNQTYDLRQTLYGLTPGYYRLHVPGFYRNGGYADVEKALNGEMLPDSTGVYTEDKLATLFAGEAEAFLLPISADLDQYNVLEEVEGASITVADSTYLVPNNMAQAAVAFMAGLYHNVLQFEVKEGQEAVEIGLKKEEAVETDWTILGAWTLEYLGTDTPSDDPTTAIEGLASVAPAKVVIYNLAGQRVQKAQKGIYIVNGKKVLF